MVDSNPDVVLANDVSWTLPEHVIVLIDSNLHGILPIHVLMAHLLVEYKMTVRPIFDFLTIA